MPSFMELFGFSNPYFPVLVLLGISLLTAVGLLFLSQKTGPKSYDKVKYSAYECGVEPLASATVRVSVKYYLIAILFIVFDLEAAFMYPWSILYRSLGWVGFVEMAVFIGILLVGLVYAWKKGALEWQ